MAAISPNNQHSFTTTFPSHNHSLMIMSHITQANTMIGDSSSFSALTEYEEEVNVYPSRSQKRGMSLVLLTNLNADFIDLDALDSCVPTKAYVWVNSKVLEEGNEDLLENEVEKMVQYIEGIYQVEIDRDFTVDIDPFIPDSLRALWEREKRHSNRKVDLSLRSALYDSKARLRMQQYRKKVGRIFPKVKFNNFGLGSTGPPPIL
jgi:hypothetical protein